MERGENPTVAYRALVVGVLAPEVLRSAEGRVISDAPEFCCWEPELDPEFVVVPSEAMIGRIWVVGGDVSW